jgi:glucose 1-dehydrogenase
MSCTRKPQKRWSNKSSRSGEKAIHVQADVSKTGDLQKLIDAAVSNFGRLDIMVNNAGVRPALSRHEPKSNISACSISTSKARCFGTQFAAKQMIAQGGGGRIINVTSVHEDWPMPGNTAYCLSKGGMRMLTRTAGLELAPHNVLVTAVGSGRGGHAYQHFDDEGSLFAGETTMTPVPLGRMAKPEGNRKALWHSSRETEQLCLQQRTLFADGGMMHSSPGL